MKPSSPCRPSSPNGAPLSVTGPVASYCPSCPSFLSPPKTSALTLIFHLALLVAGVSEVQLPALHTCLRFCCISHPWRCSFQHPSVPVPQPPPVRGSCPSSPQVAVPCAFTPCGACRFSHQEAELPLLNLRCGPGELLTSGRWDALSQNPSSAPRGSCAMRRPQVRGLLSIAPSQQHQLPAVLSEPSQRPKHQAFR